MVYKLKVIELIHLLYVMLLDFSPYLLMHVD